MSPLIFLIFMNYQNTRIFKNYKYFILADGSKLYLWIYLIYNCVKLQFYLWYTPNSLSVNADIYSEITFYHRKLNLTFYYKINSSDLMANGSIAYNRFKKFKYIVIKLPFL